MARDLHGNRRANEIQRFRIDVTPPVAKLTAAPNPALAGRIVTLDDSGSEDAGSGIVRYEWGRDGDGLFEHDTGATATTAQSSSILERSRWSCGSTDRAGLSAVARIDQRVSAENRGSGQRGISINDGARYTNDLNVTIKAKQPSFAVQKDTS